ncbi:uncharacterized protein SAPINGB_P004690 [Magnusiomyces paraingens]|uniref:Homeobox domain-containing protein n=1 Tax=Magnusiomyces paraingens TaxID=2606893 RepID=A0A5E8BX41_9ASCO|nr:uncharacterized protein SAPINGB_P004690 [Saprochaete ingens]VVT55681.1 unnamed protein product [Saprochaete ingens]
MGRQFTEANFPHPKDHLDDNDDDDNDDDDVDSYFSNNSQEVPDEIKNALDAALCETYATKLVVPFVINELSFINSLSSCLEASDEYNNILAKINLLSSKEIQKKIDTFKWKIKQPRSVNSKNEAENYNSDSDTDTDSDTDSESSANVNESHISKSKSDNNVGNNSENETLEEYYMEADESDYDGSISISDEEDNIQDLPDKINKDEIYNSDGKQPNFQSSSPSATQRPFSSMPDLIKVSSSDFNLPPPLMLQDTGLPPAVSHSENGRHLNSDNSLNFSLLLPPIRSSSLTPSVGSFSLNTQPLLKHSKSISDFPPSTGEPSQKFNPETYSGFTLPSFDLSDHEKNLNPSTPVVLRNENRTPPNLLHITNFQAMSTPSTPSTPKNQKLSDVYLKFPLKGNGGSPESPSYILTNSNLPYNNATLSYSLFYNGSPNLDKKSEKVSDMIFDLDDFKIKQEEVTDEEIFQKYNTLSDVEDTFHQSENIPGNEDSPTQYHGSSDSFESMSDDYENFSEKSDERLELPVSSRMVRADKGKGITKNTNRKKNRIPFLNMAGSKFLSGDNVDDLNTFGSPEIEDFDSDLDIEDKTVDDYVKEIQDLYTDYYNFIHNTVGPIKFAPEDVINRDLHYMNCFLKHIQDFKVIPKLSVFERSALLEKQFFKTPKINKQQVKELAEQSGLSEKSIRIWFANKRSRTKKERLKQKEVQT